MSTRSSCRGVSVAASHLSVGVGVVAASRVVVVDAATRVVVVDAASRMVVSRPTPEPGSRRARPEEYEKHGGLDGRGLEGSRIPFALVVFYVRAIL